MSKLKRSLRKYTTKEYLTANLHLNHGPLLHPPKTQSAKGARSFDMCQDESQRQEVIIFEDASII